MDVKSVVMNREFRVRTSGNEEVEFSIQKHFVTEEQQEHSTDEKSLLRFRIECL